MQTITKYKTKDGREFNNETEAKAHEFLLTKIENAVFPLGKSLEYPKSSKGWIQHSRANVEKVHRGLLILAKPLFYGKSYPVLTKAYDDNPLSIHPMSTLGRILSNSNSPIYTAWQRLMCIDKEYREHNQPYFAINGPDKEMVCVEDRS